MDPGAFWDGGGGGAGGFPPWGMPPFFPPMSHVPQERLIRWQRIGPILPAVKEGLIPVTIPVKVLENLLKDFKEEGNAFFKDKDYNVAYEMYTSALHVCKRLQLDHFVNTDKELLSTIFSNRAACLLKMDFYKESIQDCELAIQQNRCNIKAYYRMAVAYKSLREFRAALDAAKRGREQAMSMNKMHEVKEFDDLVCEVESHIPAPENKAASHAAVVKPSVKTAEKEKQESSAKNAGRGATPNSSEGKNVSGRQPPAKPKTADIVKAGGKASKDAAAATGNAKKKMESTAKKKKVPTATLR